LFFVNGHTGFALTKQGAIYSSSDGFNLYSYVETVMAGQTTNIVTMFLSEDLKTIFAVDENGILYK